MATNKLSGLQIIGGVAIIAVIALVVVIYGTGFSPGSISGNGVPMTVNSVTPVNQNGSPVTVISNDAELANTKFIVNTTVGSGTGGAQTIQANFGPQGPQNLAFTKNVKVQVNEISEFLTYGINNEGYPIYKFVSTTTSGTQCPPGTTYAISRSLVPGLQNNWYCVTETQVATKGVMTDYIYTSSAFVKLIQGNTSTDVPISAQNGQYPSTGNLVINGQTVGTAQWVGQTPTIYGPPHPNDSTIIYTPIGSSTWKIARKTWYDQYNSSYPYIRTRLALLAQSGFTSNVSFNLGPFGFNIPSCTGTACDAQLSTILSSHNSVTTGLTNDDIPVPYASGSTSTLKVGSGATQKFSVTLNNGLFFTPQINYLLNSDTLGVVINVGRPDIISVTPSSLSFPIGSTSQSTQQFTVKIKNTANASDVFGISFSSCPGVTLTSTTGTTIGPQQTQDIVVTATTTSGATVASQTCNFQVTSNSQANNFDTGSININLTQSQDCLPPGKKFQQGSNIEQCNANGIGYFFVQTCQYGVIFEADGVTPKCASAPNPNNPPVCGNNICETGENHDNCPVDCTTAPTNPIVCPSGQHLVSNSTPQYFLFWQTGTIQQNTCVPDIDLNLIITIVLVAVIVVGGIVAYSAITKKRKGH